MSTTSSTIAARPRTALVSLMVVAFLCGAAGGAAVTRTFFHSPRAAASRPNLTEPVDVTLNRWRANLDLRPAQEEQLRSILEDFHKYYDSVVAEGHERILNVLDPGQRVKFEKMMKEHQ